jgi:hypothetical protein
VLEASCSRAREREERPSGFIAALAATCRSHGLRRVGDTSSRRSKGAPATPWTDTLSGDEAAS